MKGTSTLQPEVPTGAQARCEGKANLISPKILIVDDDPDMVELLRLALTEAGYSICTAGTGTEALTEAQRCSPDLVVLDLVLPDLNGFHVCETLRRNSATASVPIIMITVLTGQFPRLIGVETGANAYINKPFRMRELVSCVEDLLSESSQASTFANAPRSLAAWQAVAAGESSASLSKRIKGNLPSRPTGFWYGSQ